MEVVVEVGDKVVAAEGRRTSDRTRGRRISYNETILAKIEEVSPKKRKYQRNGGKRKTVKVPEQKESTEMEMVRGLLGVDGDGLTGLGFKLEEVEEDGNGVVEKSDHLRVKETLRIFNNYYLHLIQVCVCL